jgi:hypothetical protein
MGNGQRFTSAQQQEQVSLAQVKACFAREGWTEARPVDVGEDAIYSIYYQERATGVNFYLQVKSVTNLAERQSDRIVRYRFDVKDLIHWEGFAYPVVLLVWDVLRDEGRWILARKALSDLDARRAGWRDQRTVTVWIPCDNTSNSVGLEKLRVSLGAYLYSTIAKGRPLEIKINFSFEPGPEGDRAHDALQSFVRDGQPASFDSTVIEGVVVSEWWEPWVGTIDPDKVYVAVSPRESDRSLWATLDAIGTQGTRATLPYLDLHVVRAGTDTALLSNTHQSYPLWVKLEMSRSAHTLKIHFGHNPGEYGHNVSLTKELMGLLQCLSEGGRLSVTFAEAPDSPFQFAYDPESGFRPDPFFVELVQDLCQIQGAMGERFRIPPEGISREDAESIHELIEIIETGKTVRNGGSGTLNVVVSDPAGLARVLQDMGPVTFKEQSEESYIALFGRDISVGPMTRVVKGTLTGSLDDLRQALLALAPGSAVELRVKDCVVTESFVRWSAQE